MKMKTLFAHLTMLVVILMTGCTQKEETIRLGFIDPLSGPFANVGQHGLRELQLFVDSVNDRGGALGGVKFEIVPVDGKANPQESLIAFRQLVDQNIKFLVHGNSSAVAGALNEAIAKHNQRNPDNAMIYLNYGAVDPILTNERCNFWHFRFDADSDMKMEAMTNMMAIDSTIKKVYLINQDYSFGHAVSNASKSMLGEKRPDIEIVGDDLHPLAKIKDFSPYIAKIRASGADSVITGNWGADLALLVKAASEAGLDVNFYTQYAGIVGGLSAMGNAAADRVKQVTMWHVNAGGDESDKLTQAYRDKFPEANDDLFFLSLKHAIEMLVLAIQTSNSTDALTVAKALENVRYTGPTGEVWIRAENHQLMQPLYVSTFKRSGVEGVKFDVERMGIGPMTNFITKAEDTFLPTTCDMQRPD
ncbi:branched-chain amino acid ABC transporter substrate-binding protein [Burkholderiales bacterium]|nr:branched-chain amino acid ABC transporter substrate-binding protein [Burkholderiales bacterium]